MKCDNEGDCFSSSVKIKAANKQMQASVWSAWAMLRGSLLIPAHQGLISTVIEAHVQISLNYFQPVTCIWVSVLGEIYSTMVLKNFLSVQPKASLWRLCLSTYCGFKMLCFNCRYVATKASFITLQSEFMQDLTLTRAKMIWHIFISVLKSRITRDRWKDCSMLGYSKTTFAYCLESCISYIGTFRSSRLLSSKG